SSDYEAQHRLEVAQRQRQPVRTVPELVADLVKQLLERAELEEQRDVVGILGIGWRAFHRETILLEKSLAHRVAPGVEQRVERRTVDLALGAIAARGRALRVIERAEHRGDVLERRRLHPALGIVARGLPFEVDDDEVAGGQQDLPEVIVAVIARAKRGDRPPAKLAEPRAQRALERLE